MGPTIKQAATIPATFSPTCPVPLNELARVQALHELCILDTPAEAMFDAAARLAASVCDTPIALISLVDRDRQWFKARIGLQAGETPRQAAFCAHAILERNLFEVVDARNDPRFADSPMVTGEPGIRFYAGMPLVTGEGYALGTLCVIDRVPRELDLKQRKALEDLAALVTAMLENCKAVVQSTQLGMILSEVFDEIMVLNPGSQKIQYANEKALINLGYDLDELQGLSVEGMSKDYPLDAIMDMDRMSPNGNRTPLRFEAVHTRRDGSAYPVEVHATLSTSVVSPQVILLVNDISSRKLDETVLRRGADADPVTGLPNRQSLIEMLDAAMPRVRRAGGYMALLIVEVERLTDIRHIYGQQVAGSVLADFAHRLQGCATARNRVAYLGGDEFAILIENVTHGLQVAKLVTGIQQNLERCFTWGQSQIPLSASIGAAYFEGGDEDAVAFLERAGAAVNMAFLNGTHQHIALLTRKGAAAAHDSRLVPHRTASSAH